MKRKYGELQKPPPRDSLIKTLETIQDLYTTCSKKEKKTQSLQTKDMSIRCRPNSSFRKTKLVDFPLVNSRQLSSVDSDKIDMKQPCPLLDVRQSIGGQCKQPQ